MTSTTQKFKEAENPVVSIVVPVYNAAEYLSEAMDALCAQSYPNIEILCVNDGSSDNSWSILQDYAKKDSRIKIFNQENSGAAKARNVGIENATGKYLMFCDADDCYEPNMCEEMVNCIITQGTDLVMCDCDFIETENHQRPEESKKYHLLKYVGELPLTYPIKCTINELLWNKIFKLDAIKQYDIRFPNGFRYEDNAFIYQYLAISSSYYGLNKKLYHYRLSANSLMGQLYAQKQHLILMDMVYAYEYSVHFMRKNGLFENNKWMLRKYQSNIWHVMRFLSASELKHFLSELKEKVLSFYDEEDIKTFPLLYKCYTGNTKDIKNSLGNPLVSVKKYCGGLIKRSVSPNERKYYFCGIPLLKRRKTPNYRKYYIFGIQYKKRPLYDTKFADYSAKTGKILNDTQKKVSSIKLSVDKELKNVKVMQMLLGMALYYKDTPEEDKYIVCFDCLYDKDAEAIDAYTFFLYLQSIHVKSKYILLRSNPLSQQVSDMKDIVLVVNQDDFLINHAALIAQSRFLVTSFGGCGNFNRYIRKIPLVKYIFIEHGVTLLKKGVCNIYNPKIFDYILVPTQKTYDLYMQESKWPKERMLISGFPRWDRLKKKNNPQKSIFIFFTWRKTFMKSPHLATRYCEKITELLTSPEFQHIIERYNIKVNLSFHHALYLHKVNIPELPDYINVVDSNHISQYISETDLLITDFSSIAFDFMLLNTPVLFYLFDYNELYLDPDDQQYIIDALSNRENLYNFCLQKQEVIEKIKHYAERGFALEEDLLKKNQAIFWQHSNNCETLYNELLRISDTDCTQH